MPRALFLVLSYFSPSSLSDLCFGTMHRNGNPIQYSCLGNPMDRGSLADYNTWGCKELELNEQLSMSSPFLLSSKCFGVYPGDMRELKMISFSICTVFPEHYENMMALFFNVYFYLLGCVGSYLQHAGSSLHHMKSFAVVHRCLAVAHMLLRSQAQ